jgi:beta-lactamase regulating signal transducer with metallopeptidase domain
MMVNDVLAVLVRLSVVGTLGILILGSLREPTRRAVGTEAAYWLWLLLPGSLIAVFLPRAPPGLCGPNAFLTPLLIRGLGAPLDLAPSFAVNSCALPVMLTWAVGAIVALVCFMYGQRVLRRSLGLLQARPDGTHRSSAAGHPMLVGGWHPQIVLPSDFETRYSATERALILAHERAHIERNDALTNAIASGLVCLFWFNPLIYWAWNRFRFDQEVACDAAVLRQAKVPRRRYARTLAKTHLAAPTAIAFGWQRRHPLIERVAILSRPAPSRVRRRMGYAAALLLMLSGTYIVWASHPDLPAPTIDGNPRIAIGLMSTVLPPDGIC